MNKTIIEKFYQSFQRLDAKSMAACYHKDVIFSDPVFKNLTYDEVTTMWEMLIKRSKGNLEIDYHTVIGDDKMAQCIWEADYEFSKTGNPVHNIIHATMEFKDGLIIRHTDEFDFWRWSKMALGLTGVLMGWSPYLKSRIRKVARLSLDKYLKGN
ncbi:nuclear transport factor 2 family protein [Ekhidna sp.]|uniref:nuclear transport factor 2 family protein n=1 Tax=Ekhidna sp. TaxID=2608089 RepID=UPI003C7AD049